MKKLSVLFIAVLEIAFSLSACSSYTDNGNGTVTDKKTKLVCKKCSMGQNNNASCSGKATKATWWNALKYCKNLKLDNRKWRLPDIRELRSLVDKSKIKPSINTEKFPATVSSQYWSSSTNANITYNAWNVYFLNGYATRFGLKTDRYYVRCVSGP